MGRKIKQTKTSANNSSAAQGNSPAQSAVPTKAPTKEDIAEMLKRIEGLKVQLTDNLNKILAKYDSYVWANYSRALASMDDYVWIKINPKIQKSNPMAFATRNRNRNSFGVYEVYVNSSIPRTIKKPLEMHEFGHIIYSHLLMVKQQRDIIISKIKTFWPSIKLHLNDEIIKKTEEDPSYADYLCQRISNTILNIAEDFEVNSKMFPTNEEQDMLIKYTSIAQCFCILKDNNVSEKGYERAIHWTEYELGTRIPKKGNKPVPFALPCLPRDMKFKDGLEFNNYVDLIISHDNDFFKYAKNRMGVKAEYQEATEDDLKRMADSPEEMGENDPYISDGDLMDGPDMPSQGDGQQSATKQKPTLATEKCKHTSNPNASSTMEDWNPGNVPPPSKNGKDGKESGDDKDSQDGSGSGKDGDKLNSEDIDKIANSYSDGDNDRNAEEINEALQRENEANGNATASSDGGDGQSRSDDDGDSSASSAAYAKREPDSDVINLSNSKGIENFILKVCFNKIHTNTRVDNLYYYNRRRFSTDRLIPKKRTENRYKPGNVYMLVDISGSVSDTAVGNMIKAVKNVAKHCGRKSRIIWWDERCCGDYSLLTMKPGIAVTGGTSLAGGIKYISKKYLNHNNDKLVIISDYQDNLDEWYTELCKIKGDAMGLCWTTEGSSDVNSYIDSLSSYSYRTISVSSSELLKKIPTVLINITE